MTSKDIFDDVFPQDRQIGGDHYKDMAIQPFEFISKNLPWLKFAYHDVLQSLG